MSLSERVFSLFASFSPGGSNILSPSESQHNVGAYRAGGQLGSPDIGSQTPREAQALDDYEEEYRPPYLHVCLGHCQLRLIWGADRCRP